MAELVVSGEACCCCGVAKPVNEIPDAGEGKPFSVSILGCARCRRRVAAAAEAVDFAPDRVDWAGALGYHARPRTIPLSATPFSFFT